MRAEWDIERYLRNGRLVQVLPQYYTPDADIYAVYPQRHQRAARVRAFVDFSPRRSRNGRLQEVAPRIAGRETRPLLTASKRRVLNAAPRMSAVRWLLSRRTWMLRT